MKHLHDQDWEWVIIQRIRELRRLNPQGDELKALQEELVAAFEGDVRDTAEQIRRKDISSEVLRQDDPVRDGILEGYLREWIIRYSVKYYNPQKNNSFAKYVFTGWRDIAFQVYLKEFEPPTGRIAGPDGNVMDKIIRLVSIETPVGTEEGEEVSLGELLSTDRRVPRDQEIDRKTIDCRDSLDVLARKSCVHPERLLQLLRALAYQNCESDETDEHRRRDAMLALLRDDLSCPDCSDEFQRRQWWNSLVAEQE
jgi:hypothetical protein